MKRGTTPIHQFVLPFSADMLEDVEITYFQNDKEILKKYLEHCTAEGKTVSVMLSQEETFSFVEGINIRIQIRVLTRGGEVHASDIFVIDCKACLSDEVL